MAKDPVCNMEVDEANPAATTEHNGQKYYFCAEACKVSFEADPEKYLGGAEKGGGCCGDS